jgi:NAD(P)-dependent dehydrogenase (short-subunit alcohol dehydrogenase family)
VPAILAHKVAINTGASSGIGWAAAKLFASLARSALYLASDASAFTTGTALLVEGGVSISRS